MLLTCCMQRQPLLIEKPTHLAISSPASSRWEACYGLNYSPFVSGVVSGQEKRHTERVNSITMAPLGLIEGRLRWRWSTNFFFFLQRYWLFIDRLQPRDVRGTAEALTRLSSVWMGCITFRSAYDFAGHPSYGRRKKCQGHLLSINEFRTCRRQANPVNRRMCG